LSIVPRSGKTGLAVSSDPASVETYSFDEYKLYYESTEKVVDRRLALNSWNYGLCVALMGAIGGLTAWALPQPEFRLLLLLGDSAFALAGTLLCILWVGQIRDFKLLNNAKFDVLNAMAPKVAFPESAVLKSAEPFAKEWQALERQRATAEISQSNIVVLRASHAEFLVPRAFIALFVGVIITCAAFGLINWAAIREAAFELTAASTVRGVGNATEGAINGR
jgi:hypothetical protein